MSIGRVGRGVGANINYVFTGGRSAGTADSLVYSFSRRVAGFSLNGGLVTEFVFSPQGKSEGILFSQK